MGGSFDYPIIYIIERKPLTKSKKSIYLNDIPLPDALECFQNALQAIGLWKTLAVEQIPLDENAVGRVLAETVWARKSSPHYHASAMDGFALRAAETAEAGPNNPVILEVGKHTIYIDTGDPLPEWADSVVPIELVEPVSRTGSTVGNIRNPFGIRLRASLPPWSHVRPMGEDIVATQIVLTSGQILRPVDLGAIAASGHSQVLVSRKPRVAIIPTGSELVPVGVDAKRGEIIEYNSIVLSAQIKTWGAEPVRFPIIPDIKGQILDQVQKAADEFDLILLNAGSSAGSEDFSAQVIEELGTLLVHGVAVRPGHPVILGLINLSSTKTTEKRQTPIIGVPGYPVSAVITGEIFTEPLIAKWLGRNPFAPIEVPAALTKKVTSPAGDDDYMRVVVGVVGDRLLAAPLSRGAGVITSLVKADGIAIIPRGIQGLEAGSTINVRLTRSHGELDGTIFAIGSHDITLDLLSQYLSGARRRLVSANVGSLAGLLALKKGESHLVGSHLLDPKTGEYNLSYIRQYLPDAKVRVIHWVMREQGLIVQRGNPKCIRSLDDLRQKDIVYVNRQRGAGTRVLLDYHLEKMGIVSSEISGYDREEYTHLGVAVAISSGRADCGLGIAAAAQALDLDFIPLFEEEYDLVIPRVFCEGELLAPLFNIMTEKSFKDSISTLSGYNVKDMGKIVVDF